MTCYNIERLEGRNFSLKVFKHYLMLLITAWIKESMDPKELCRTISCVQHKCLIKSNSSKRNNLILQMVNLNTIFNLETHSLAAWIQGYITLGFYCAPFPLKNFVLNSESRHFWTFSNFRGFFCYVWWIFKINYTYDYEYIHIFI